MGSVMVGYLERQRGLEQQSVDELSHKKMTGAQVWVPVMSWYLEQRRALEQQVKKYSDPPSEHLLPDLPPHARCPTRPPSLMLVRFSVLLQCDKMLFGVL